MNFIFHWKLIGGDMFTQNFNGFDSEAAAKKAWRRFWGADFTAKKYLEFLTIKTLDEENV